MSGRPSVRQHPNFVIGAALVAFVAAVAVVSLVWTPFDPTRADPSSALLGYFERGHVLGTDSYGRDLLSQLMVGARSALLVGVLAVAIAAAIGVPLGAIAASRRGWIEDLIMRSADVVYAFPAVLLAILLGAAFSRGVWSAMAAIGIAYVPVFARVTRSASLSVLELDFVNAARAYGRSRRYILARHVIPNIASVLIVQITVLFALAILAEAALSFLGLGAQPPTPSWGRSLNEAQTYLRIDARLAIWPGLAIAATVLGFNLLGDGLRDILDPKLEAQR